MECLMHFPAVRQVEDGISSAEQLVKIREELREFFAAAPGSFHKVMEGWDVIAAVENWLRVQAREGIDVERARDEVFDKALLRNYYGGDDRGAGMVEASRMVVRGLVRERQNLVRECDTLRAEIAELKKRMLHIAALSVGGAR